MNHPPSEAAPAAVQRAAAPLVLRVLSGRQSQVETVLAAGNYLLGNDADSCDIVVDLGLPDRHSVYLRVEGDRITLLAVSGDVWVSDRHLRGQESLPLLRGEVFTLGLVSMAIADAGFDFAALKLPGALRKAGDRPELAAVALPPRTPAALRAAGVFRAALLGTCAVSVAAALVWGSGAVSAQRDAAPTASDALERLQAQLDSLPGHELKVQLEGGERHLVVEGFVPDTDAHAQLERSLQRWPRAAVMRVYPVAPLQHSLERRFAEVAAEVQLSYRGDGAFELHAGSNEVQALRDAGERAMKDMPGLKALHVVLGDVKLRESGEPARLTLSRSTARLGQIVVAGSALPWPPAQPQAPRFAEVRWGDVPSVLTRQGERLFVGARLADGGVISRIERNAVVVARAGAEREEPVGLLPASPTVDNNPP